MFIVYTYVEHIQNGARSGNGMTTNVYNINDMQLRLRINNRNEHFTK